MSTDKASSPDFDDDAPLGSFPSEILKLFNDLLNNAQNSLDTHPPNVVLVLLRDMGFSRHIPIWWKPRYFITEAISAMKNMKFHTGQQLLFAAPQAWYNKMAEGGPYEFSRVIRTQSPTC